MTDHDLPGEAVEPPPPRITPQQWMVVGLAIALAVAGVLYRCWS